MSNLKCAAIFTLSTLLTACISPVGPQASGVETPSVWNRLIGETKTANRHAPLAANTDAEIDQLWWKHFKDPTLDTLISKALANNKSLQIAKARVEAARAGRTLAQSGLFPQITGVGSAQRGNQGYASLDQNISIAQADIQASWDLDLFGHTQARTAQATAILQSTEASQQAIRVALLAEVAHTYFNMRKYERQIALTKANLITEKKTLELVKAQKEGALASDLDVQRESAQVSMTEALIPALQIAYDASVNRLNILLGVAPGMQNALIKTGQPLSPLDPQIVIAAPAKVLANRPDVRVAERQFAATISGKDAAKAQLFPDISLTALFGLQTATPFSSTPWTVGLNLVQPILNFGQIESQIDIADAEQKQAFLNYQNTVLQALEDMENALSSYIHETTRNASLTRSVAENQKATHLVRQLYSNGYTGLLDVLIAQRNLLDAEVNQAESNANLRNSLINIYTAAGGGWGE